MDAGQLGTLRKLASGGQGQLYEIDDAQTARLGLTPPIVYKEYLVRTPPGANDELRRRVEWLEALDADDREALLAVAAWPLAIVRGPDHALQGILMRNLTPSFSAPLQLPSGRRLAVLVSLEHALEDDGRLQRRFGVTVDTRARARIAASIAGSLQTLHRDGIVASDISQRNILVQLEAPYRTAFIDCDGMVFRGRQTLGVVETPGWEIGPWTGESPTTKEADNLKLALAILRLFARHQSETEPAAAAAYVPDSLLPMLRQALGPGRRPTAGEWQRTLTALPFNTLNRTHPGPPPRRSTTTHRAAAPPRPGTPTSPPPRVAPTTPPPAIAAPQPTVARPGPASGGRLRTPVGVVLFLIAVGLGIAALAINGNNAGGSSPGGDDPNEHASTSTSTTSRSTPPASDDHRPDGTSRPPRRSAASRALARHYRYLSAGRYEEAFALMTPAYQRANQRWVSLRRKADPHIRVVLLRQRSRNGARATVTIRFYARDSVTVQGSDTKCRQFRGDAQMVRLDGRWHFKPRRSGYYGRVVDSTLCH